MLEKYDAALEGWIEHTVANGDDDALFASGYLQGHIAVVFSQLEQEQLSGIDALDEKMVDCLALANDELESADFALVQSAWQQLRKIISEIQ
ncbi:YfcL family protein [Shewanella olleyana]|uniref:YfcL family protein n=1 Tax=Shewanella olleyana TaxID=135626 RepID=UPI00200D73AD|nr:YfcL family protein [Shewanella olleyana]MCL1065224.1 YfcL family protein [Shewanella olleyana]